MIPRVIWKSSLTEELDQEQSTRQKHKVGKRQRKKIIWHSRHFPGNASQLEFMTSTAYEHIAEPLWDIHRSTVIQSDPSASGKLRQESATRGESESDHKYEEKNGRAARRAIAAGFSSRWLLRVRAYTRDITAHIYNCPNIPAISWRHGVIIVCALDFVYSLYISTTALGPFIWGNKWGSLTANRRK
jgi:hypothetical protein